MQYVSAGFDWEYMRQREGCSAGVIHRYTSEALHASPVQVR